MSKRFLSGLLVLALGSSVVADEQMRVTADDVNVRCGPGSRFEIVCQAHKGDLLTVRRLIEGWAEIVPPDDAKLWVYAELIEDGAIIATRVQIRSGPGISYRPAGKLDKGYAVSVRETVGDWCRIAPPPEAAVWISRDYLEAIQPGEAEKPGGDGAPSAPQAPSARTPASRHPAPAPVASPRPPPRRMPAVAPQAAAPAAPASEPQETVVETPTRASEKVVSLPVALRGRRLDPERRQGDVVILEGEIREARGIWGKLSAFRLVGRDAKGRIRTRCYLLGNAEQLGAVLGRRASVEGRQYWVYRVRYPGVRPERIRLYPEAE